MGNNQLTSDKGIVTVSQAEIISKVNPMIEILQNIAIDPPLLERAKYSNIELNQLTDIVSLIKQNYEKSTSEIVENQVESIKNKLFTEMKRVDVQFSGTLTPHLIAHLAIIKTQVNRSQIKERISALDDDIEHISRQLIEISDHLKKLENLLP